MSSSDETDMNEYVVEISTDKMSQPKPVEIRFRDVKYDVTTTTKKMMGIKGATTDHRQILKGLSGDIQPGSLTAIMGGSGN